MATDTNLTAILVDDEKNSREALRKKLQLHCPQVEILAECSNGAEGITAINEHDPQIVFLDIEMPKMNGFTMLQQLPEKKFELIFTTAYNQYAIDAIRFSAFDYLVKPVEVTELVNALNRIMEKRSAISNASRLDVLLGHLLKEKNTVQKIVVSTMESMELVELDSIIYFEAVGNYTSIHLAGNRTILASRTLKDFEDILPEDQFYRIHNASVVNIGYVQKYIRGDGGQLVLKNGTILDVARRRKDDLLKLITLHAARI